MSPERFGIHPDVLEAIGIRFLQPDSGELLFPLTDYAGVELAKPEMLLPDGRVVGQPDFFFEHGLGNGQSNRLFLFSSITDLLAFYQLNRSRIGEGAILTAIGSNPDSVWMKSYLSELLRKHRNLKIDLAFSHDLLGRINDIRLACWLKGRDVQIGSADGLIHLKTDFYEASLPVEKLSLSAFCKASGFRTRLRTLKPTSGNCFWEQLGRTS